MRDHSMQVEFHGAVSSVGGFSTESTLEHNFTEQNLQAMSDEARERSFNLITKSRGKRLLLPSREESVSEELGRHREEGHIDSLIIACKAHSTLAAISRLQKRLSSKSTVVLLQNGNIATHDELLRTVFTNEQERPHIILVSNTHGAWLKYPPFHIVHAGVGQLRFSIVPERGRNFERSYNDKEGKGALSVDDIARASGDPEMERYLSLRNTVAVLQRMSALRASWEPHTKMQVLLRQKLVVNAVINPLTTILGCRNGVLFENAPAERLAYRICSEASAVYKAEAAAGLRETDMSKVYLPAELKSPNLMRECKHVAEITAQNTSSMLADLKKGNRMTEIKYLNGHLLDLGNRYRVETPINATMVDLVIMRTQLPLDQFD